MTEYHNGGNVESDEKMGLAALLAQSTPGIAITGVLYGLAVTQTATASGSVQIAQGAGAVQASLTAGASLLYNPAPTLNILTANPVGSLPRNDIVVFDATTAVVSVIIGTANATPTDPTVPATALKLARIRNIANAVAIDAGHIDDLRVYTRLAGTDVPAYSSRVQTAGQAITTNTWTLMQGWSLGDEYNMNYSASNWFPQVAGRYKINGLITFPAVASPTGQRAVRLYRNGTLIGEFSGVRADTTYNCCIPFFGGSTVVVGDSFSVQVFQSQGSNQVTVSGPGACQISIDRVSGS